MPRESRYAAIILKKQPLNEGDEIITFFTKEQGKVRALAKSVKLQKSKLQQKLQVLFLVDAILSGGKLPKIIGAEPKKVFRHIREHLAALKVAFYAIELALKFTPDEQKNEPLFNLLENFLEFLNSRHNEETLNLGLLKFKAEILAVSGFNLRHAKNAKQAPVFFSQNRGGFFAEKYPDAVLVHKTAYELFLQISQSDFARLSAIKHQGQRLPEIQDLLSKFIEFQLERQVKSEKYLKQPNVV